MRAGTATPHTHAAVPAILRNKIRFGRFFEGEKKLLKGSAMLLSWQHCISISPTMGRATGQAENMHCVDHELIKLVLLK